MSIPARNRAGLSIKVTTRQCDRRGSLVNPQYLTTWLHQGRTLGWQIDYLTPGAQALFPGMVADIILEHDALARRIIIDTKFTSILARSQHKEAVLKSGYIYQLYTYLRSQERADDPLSLTASGMFLHPTVDGEIDESVRIQGHEVRFATVDLMQETADVLPRMRSLVPVGRA